MTPASVGEWESANQKVDPSEASSQQASLERSRCAEMPGCQIVRKWFNFLLIWNSNKNNVKQKPFANSNMHNGELIKIYHLGMKLPHTEEI